MATRPPTEIARRLAAGRLITGTARIGGTLEGMIATLDEIPIETLMTGAEAAEALVRLTDVRERLTDVIRRHARYAARTAPERHDAAELNALAIELSNTLREAGLTAPDRTPTARPVLPTAEQVRSLTATEAAQLASDMNTEAERTSRAAYYADDDRDAQHWGQT